MYLDDRFILLVEHQFLFKAFKIPGQCDGEEGKGNIDPVNIYFWDNYSSSFTSIALRKENSLTIQFSQKETDLVIVDKHDLPEIVSAGYKIGQMDSVPDFGSTN